MSAPVEDKAEAFVAYLQSLRARGDRAALAALRRCLAIDLDEPGNLRALRYLSPFLQGEPHLRQRAYWLVAGLFAQHPTDPGEPGGSLAAVLGRLYRDHRGLEHRFLALLESDADQLAPRLRRVMGIVRSARIALDYANLLRDLLSWFVPGRPVQLRWAREFYAEAHQDTQEVTV